MAAMTPEKLLAGILSAYSETDGLHISFELKEMLDTAEAEFDGIEEVEMIDVQARPEET